MKNDPVDDMPHSLSTFTLKQTTNCFTSGHAVSWLASVPQLRCTLVFWH